MDAILKEYISKIRSGLKGWSPESIDEAVSYYEEFIEDAIEQGLSETEILNRLGNPKEIVDIIKAENSIGRTERNPGPLKLMKSIIGVPALKVSIFLGSLFPIATAYLLYIFAVTSYIAIAGGVFISIYGIRQIPSKYVWEIIGMVGLGLVSVGIFGSLGYLIWKFANIITIRTMKLLRKYLNINRDKKIMEEVSNIDAGDMTSGIKRRTKSVTIVFAVILLIGVAMIIPSGLPERYFSIWNSRIPSSFTIKKEEFKPEEIRSIFIETLNSQIVLKEIDSKEIVVSYQEPDWMKGMFKKEDKQITFTETQNGRLPYMRFISRHEGMTKVTVMLPAGYAAEIIDIRTNGGTVKIEGLSKIYDISVKAGKGKIIFKNTLLEDAFFRSNGKGKGIIRIEDKNGIVKID